MRISHLLLLLSLSNLFSCLVFAAPGETGNGGYGVKCQNEIVTLDYFEAKVNGNLDSIVNDSEIDKDLDLEIEK